MSFDPHQHGNAVRLPPAGEVNSPGDIHYDGRDLEVLAAAPNYHEWLLRAFLPYFGKNLAEVGAGIGNIAARLLQLPLSNLHLIEPSTNMFARLRENMVQRMRGPQLHFYNSGLASAAPELKKQGIDTFLYVNVLEHVEDDVAELRLMHDILSAGGRICIFVPALPWLYGAKDRKLGHFRRYSRSELVTKCEQAGFAIERVKWFDIIGVLPWWVKHSLLGHDAVTPDEIRIYDRWVIPLCAFVESLVAVPFGKNLILVARKKS